jgi:hypothetical protein
MEDDTTQFWTEKQVARYLNRSREALRAWRARGVGPEYVKDPMGRVHYPKEKVKQWMEG